MKSTKYRRCYRMRTRNASTWTKCDTCPDAAENASDFMVQKATNNWNESIAQLPLWCREIVHSKLWMGACTQCNLLVHFIGFRSPNLHTIQATMHFIYFLLLFSHAPHWVMRSGSYLTAIADIKINKKIIIIFGVHTMQVSSNKRINKRNYGIILFCIEWLAAAAFGELQTHKSNKI